MIKYISVLTLLISLFSCNEPQSKDDKAFEINQLSNLITDSIKIAIDNECDPNIHIYDLTALRRDVSTILFVNPITFAEYLDMKKMPTAFYEQKKRLFLIYSGLEELITPDKDFQSLIRRKYDSTCGKYNILKQTGINDTNGVFFEIKDGKLMKYSNSRPDFYDFFFDRKFDTSKYVPANVE